ncbi:hypothetical protein GA0070624_4125 [Micromonospora rhizosphaerae]|uniref:DUF5709 domain-containing protein n=1 Tax=Micromonospora rhizosphaerae TaxID=568872 RepID=A0A1C6SMV2_9ACTN|nr:hypothetical protein [Micromonospora rhizosphaerae]SCL30692.1 hypothetical protein GA0070624_4125 [Micromonospora rhizosphaerae]
MTANWDEQADALGEASEADVLEQQQDETDVGPPDTVSAAVPEASEADLAEQGVLVPNHEGDRPTSVPADTNPPDVLEQHQAIPIPDEERRD